MIRQINKIRDQTKLENELQAQSKVLRKDIENLEQQSTKIKEQTKQKSLELIETEKKYLQVFDISIVNSTNQAKIIANYNIEKENTLKSQSELK